MEQLPRHRVVLTVEGPQGAKPQWMVDNLDESEAYMLSVSLSNILFSPEWTEFDIYKSKPYREYKERYTEGAVFYVIADALNVRAEPTILATVRYTLPYKTKVFVAQVVEGEDNGKWAEIGVDQWVSAEWIQVEGDEWD